MSLESNVLALAQRVGAEDKALRTLLNGNAGNLAALTTTAKSNLVVALNELHAAIAGSSGIDDGTTSSSSTWSSTKITASIQAAIDALVASAPGLLNTLDELAAALGDDPNFAATTATALGNRLRVDVNNQGLDGTRQANGRTNIGAAAASDLATLTTNVGDTTTNFVTAFEAALV